MLKKTICLIFLLAINSICRSMNPPQNLSDVDADVNDAESKDQFPLLIRTFSLRKQVAIKIIEFIATGLIDPDHLKVLPEELISYLEIHCLIESLNPESRRKLKLPPEIKTDFNFLTSIYLIDEDSELFNNLNLLHQGLQQIDLSKSHCIELNTKVTYIYKPVITPIQTLTNILNKKTKSNNQKIDGDYNSETLVKYCVLFNNLNLIKFLSSVIDLPLTMECFDCKCMGSSIIDLACIAPENNSETIEFLISNIKEQQGLKLEQIVSEQAVLRGLISLHPEKRKYLKNIALSLEIDLNQHIGTPPEKCSFTILCVLWGYNKAFKIFFRQIKPSNEQEVYRDVIEHLRYISESYENPISAQILKKQLKILTMLEREIEKEPTKFDDTTKAKILEIRYNLNQLINNQ